MIPIFLSYPKPFLPNQEAFIKDVISYLTERGFDPRTLGVSEYDMEAPLNAIRRMILESHGLLSIAFKKTFATEVIRRPGEQLLKPPEDHNPDGIIDTELKFKNIWFTSSWCHIEAAMAYQVGLPILILREKNVFIEGVLESGAVGLYMPEIDLDNTELKYFSTPEGQNLIAQWEAYVRTVVKTKGSPPKLY